MGRAVRNRNTDGWFARRRIGRGVAREVVRRVAIRAVICCCCAAPASANDTAELEDAAARLQYAFHTADTRALEQTLAALERLPVNSANAGLKDYYMAFGRWKLAQAFADPREGQPARQARARASKEAQACLRHANAAVDADPQSADAYALLAACGTLVEDLRIVGLRDSAAACARDKALRRALELEPTNPRVVFVEALCAHDRSPPGDATALEKLRTAVRLFAAAPPSSPGRPDWGQAEALLYLGQRYLESGDPQAARDAIERALVLAPDYRAAQEVLLKAARRPQ